jgi:hypothetical protein
MAKKTNVFKCGTSHLTAKADRDRNRAAKKPRCLICHARRIGSYLVCTRCRTGVGGL